MGDGCRPKTTTSGRGEKQKRRDFFHLRLLPQLLGPRQGKPDGPGGIQATRPHDRYVCTGWKNGRTQTCIHEWVIYFYFFYFGGGVDTRRQCVSITQTKRLSVVQSRGNAAKPRISLIKMCSKKALFSTPHPHPNPRLCVRLSARWGRLLFCLERHRANATRRYFFFEENKSKRFFLFLYLFIIFLFLMRCHCQKAAQSAIETDGRRGNIGLVYCATPDELRRPVFLYFWGEINKILHTSYEPQTEKLKVQAAKKKKKKKITDQRSNAFSGRDGVMRVTRQNISNNQW